MLYTIYKVTNKINGKIYIGKHQTKNPNDGYFGSGKFIKSAIRKYGKENFAKEVLFIFETELEMNQKEKELITEEFVSRKDTYNAGVGGEGGPHFKGKSHSDDAKKKMASFKGKTHSKEAREKISASNKRRTLSEETKRKLSEKAFSRSKKTQKPTKEKYITQKSSKEKYIMTEEHKMKISASVKKSNIKNENVIQNVICPHCLKEGQKLAMFRYHFNNCKLSREGQDG